MKKQETSVRNADTTPQSSAAKNYSAVKEMLAKFPLTFPRSLIAYHLVRKGIYPSDPELIDIISLIAHVFVDIMKIPATALIAETLKHQGIKYAFGVAGIPILKLAKDLQKHGISFIGMRNEQSGSYAASAIGFLTGRPGLCLSTAGPGFANCLTGALHAKENKWPMIFINYDGGFLELPQCHLAQAFVKYSSCVSSAASIPLQIAKSIQQSISGAVGPVYIDVSSEVLEEIVEMDQNLPSPALVADPPKMCAPKELLERALGTLKSSRRPLLIIGKGTSYGKCENEMREFVKRFKTPFISMPMAKGVISDSSEFCVSSARSAALSNADVVLVIGARLNWMLGFGSSRTFDTDVQFIHVDIDSNEIGRNMGNVLGIQAHASEFVKQILKLAENNHVDWCCDKDSDWWKFLRNKVTENKKKIDELIASQQEEIGFHSAFRCIRTVIPPNSVIINEGANTMDIGRIMFSHEFPRMRLDAGTLGTMGVGPGFAIAASLVYKNTGNPIVCVSGDSAFGFSAMEFETAVRYNLPIIFIVVNNGGIYTHDDKLSSDSDYLPFSLSPLYLNVDSDYEKIAEAFHCNGYRCDSLSELAAALKKCLKSENEKPSLINLKVNPKTGKGYPNHY